MKIALGADHAGYQLKDKIKQHLEQQGLEVRDEGTLSGESVDYPDYARLVAHDVNEQRRISASWYAAPGSAWPSRPIRLWVSGLLMSPLSMRRR